MDPGIHAILFSTHNQAYPDHVHNTRLADLVFSVQFTGQKPQLELKKVGQQSKSRYSKQHGFVDFRDMLAAECKLTLDCS